MPLIKCHFCNNGVAPDEGACPYCNGQGKIMETGVLHNTAAEPAPRIYVRVTMLDQLADAYVVRVVECSHYAIAMGVLMFFGAPTDDMPFLAFAVWEAAEVVPPPTQRSTKP